jgi:peptidoglycan hydrolase-like protein with peptidoglycan-binding domain
MRRLIPLFCSLLLTVSSVYATDQLRNVQTELKNQGFFYGEIDGKPSAELNAAIRRYQIRNGMEISGELVEPTLKALGYGGATDHPAAKPKSNPKPPQEAPAQAAPPPATKPPVHLRKEESVQESDRRALEAERNQAGRPQDRSVIRPPAPMDEPTDREPSELYADMFARTPYATAPKSVQEDTVRRAQSLLASRGFYRNDIDGDPGPAMEEAILTFQRRSRLPLTGRLDLQTLSVLGLLPNRTRANPRTSPYAMPDRNPRQQVYRGVWVE